VGGLDLGAWGKVVLEDVAGCHCYVARPETVVAESEEGVTGMVWQLPKLSHSGVARVPPPNTERPSH